MSLNADEAVAITGLEHRNQANTFFTVFMVKFRGRTTARRYSEFASLHKTLSGLFPVQMTSFNVRLPKKAFFNRDPKFLEERRVLLENYLKHLMAVPEFRSSPALKNFLQATDDTVPVFVDVQLSTASSSLSGTSSVRASTVSMVHDDDDIDSLMQQVRSNPSMRNTATSSGFI